MSHTFHEPATVYRILCLIAQCFLTVVFIVCLGRARGRVWLEASSLLHTYPLVRPIRLD